MKRILPLLIAFTVLFSLFACSSSSGSSDNGNALEVRDGDVLFSFSERDLSDDYSEAGATTVLFSPDGITVEGNGADVADNVVTIRSAGTYLLSGSSDNARIVVRAEDKKAKVQLVLRGLTLQSDACPLLIEKADKTFLTLAEGTDNQLTDGESYELTAGKSPVDACVFSKDSLTVNGSGALTVCGNYAHGIVSKDHLRFADAQVSVRSARTGIEGKDSVQISGASISVEANADGIRATNADNPSKGAVYLASGEINVRARHDGISAASLLRIDEGTVDVRSGPKAKEDDAFTAKDPKVSQKALKSAGDLHICGGTFYLRSSDDALHANRAIDLSGGSFDIRTGDDAVRAGTLLSVSGVSFQTSDCKEGLKGHDIRIEDGTVRINAIQDGINASGSPECSIQISGGYLLLDAREDGIDSSGSLSISGGTVLISGPVTDTDTALDYETEGSITGGVVMACSSTNMVETLSGDSQGILMLPLEVFEGIRVSVCDEAEHVILSYIFAKQPYALICSSPLIRPDGTYTIWSGGTLDGIDENGFYQGGEATLDGGERIDTVSMDGHTVYNGLFGRSYHPAETGNEETVLPPAPPHD